MAGNCTLLFFAPRTLTNASIAKINEKLRVRAAEHSATEGSATPQLSKPSRPHLEPARLPSPLASRDEDASSSTSSSPLITATPHTLELDQ